MKPIRNDGRVWLRVAAITGLAVLLASALTVLGSRYTNIPIAITGAVVQQNDDPRKQAPIADVEVRVESGKAGPAATSNAAGYFRLVLPPELRNGETIALQFRRSGYEPFDLKTVAGDDLHVIHMEPLPENVQPPPNRPEVVIANTLVRYSTETRAEVNIGTAIKTFEVQNTGDIPCPSHSPCSPDGNWKAAIGSASLDAGPGNVFENARVSCIAGPCPFTRIESDGFSRGGRNISVSVRDWSDTTTFLLEAEVFGQQVSDIVRQSYPAILGRTFDFSLPASAEGPSLEAELSGDQITFPLGPIPNLSWAACIVTVAKDRSKSYRCELKPGFKFQ